MSLPASRDPSSPEPGKARKRLVRRGISLLLCLVLAVTLGWTGWHWAQTSQRAEQAVSMKVQLRNARDTVYLYKLPGQATPPQAKPSGELPGAVYRFRVTPLKGPVVELTPEEFAARLYQDQRSRGLVSRFLNITSFWGFFWVGLGLLGQLLFTGRMIIQWLASEKHRRSVVPTAFWWMSIIGATMLLVYFIWRQDIVGVLGQSVGWFIYVRNLWLIYLSQPTLLQPIPENSTPTTP